MKWRVLVCDSNPESRHIICSALREYEPIEVSVAEAELARLFQKQGPRIAILALGEDGAEGSVICNQIEKRGDHPDLYVILVGTKEQRKELARGIRAGADDFLTQPLDAFELETRVRCGERALEMREALDCCQQKIDFQSSHDPLTGTWNRIAILDVLHRELSRVERQGKPVAVQLVEVGGLRNLNDTFGYAAGDDALRAVTRRLSSLLRPYDTLGRYGGDTFLIVVPGCDEKSALSQALRLQADLVERPIESVHWRKYAQTSDSSTRITLSIGAASVGSKVGPELLLRAAEAALQRAKRGARNRVESVSLFLAEPRAEAA